jgi:hypothetical protein
MQQEYPGREFIFVADDWGSGIASHYAAIFKAISPLIVGLLQINTDSHLQTIH